MTVYADGRLPETSRLGAYGGTSALLKNACAAVIAAFRTWRIRARQRRELMMLSQRELGDMRLSETDADSEARKPFWQRLGLPGQD